MNEHAAIDHTPIDAAAHTVTAAGDTRTGPRRVRAACSIALATGAIAVLTG